MSKKEKNLAASIPLKKAEKIRKKLFQKKLVKKNLKLIKDKNKLYIPLKKKIKTNSEFKITEKKFPKKTKKIKDYKKIAKIPKKLKKFLPTSFDIIGTIILIKIPEQLEKHKNKIGKALLKTHPHIKTICNIKPVSGEFRTRNIEIIAGEQKTTTTHKEYGIKIKLDIKKTYFSPRLSNERKRITQQVKKNENILDMFTGVAPFAIMIAKHSKPKKITAVDKNPNAIKYAQKNIVQNHVADKIKIYKKDAKKIPETINEKFDRIIMNLPFKSHKYIKHALKNTKKQATIHLYSILTEEETSKLIKKIEKKAKQKKYNIQNININKIKSYSPRQFYIGFDITIQKKQ
ncbi:MAG: methyltransferase [Candidatus Thermoplasmatota archaeon]